MPRSLPSSSAWTSPPVVPSSATRRTSDNDNVRTVHLSVWFLRPGSAVHRNQAERHARRGPEPAVPRLQHRRPQVRPEGRLEAPASRLDPRPRRHRRLRGRRRNLEDDGKRAIKRGRATKEWRGRKHEPMRAKDHPITQMWYARHGIITPEMQYVAPARTAMWSSCAPSWPPAAR